MPYEITIPKDKESREAMYLWLFDEAKRGRRVEEVNWWVAYHYLRGAREFSAVDYVKGTVDVSYMNEAGELKFRYDGLVKNFMTQVGRLMAIDLRPSVDRRNMGLEDLQKASLAQIILDSQVPQQKVDELKLKLIPQLCRYGTMGLKVWRYEDMFGVEVIPPWQLLPLPPNPTEETDVRGLAHQRTVPLKWVKELTISKGKGDKFWNEVDKRNVPAGSIKSGTGQFFTTFGESVPKGPLMGYENQKKKKGLEREEEVVVFTEVYWYSEAGFLKRYEVVVGTKILYEIDYPESRLYLPLQVVRDIPTGGFWGRSYVGTLIPLNIEIEYAAGRLFQNLDELDAYGMVLWPNTMGVPSEGMKRMDGMRFVPYEPDYTVPNQAPQVVAPANSGSFPRDVMNIGKALMDDVANQPVALTSGDAPGRVDSQAALGFLYEVSNTPLGAPAESIAQAMTGIYQAMLDLISMHWAPGQMVEVSLLDDSVAGIQLDAKTGTVQLKENGVPSPQEVVITVRSKLPKSREQEKMELADLLERGIIDAFDYRITARKKGLDLPTGNEAEWQNYRRAVLNNIVLFGDGQTPGKAIKAETDMPTVHLRVMGAFMARPEFYMASDAVRNAFVEMYQSYQIGMGAYPEGAPSPDEGAMEQQGFIQNMAQLAQGGMPGMEMGM